MFSVSYDASLGVVRFAGEGFYSHADEQNAAKAAEIAISECRAAHDDLKVLIVCASMVQDSSVMEAASKRQSMTTGSRDRVAFVCENSLTKMQASRVFKSEKCQCFVSEHAAVTWLLANRETPRVRAA